MFEIVAFWVLFIWYLVEEVTVLVLQNEFVEDKFIELRGDYFDTLGAINALIFESVTLEKLKEQIGFQYGYLKEEVEHAHTMDKVISLFHEKHDTFPRVVELRGLVRGLRLYEAVKEIDKFNERKREVYKTILAKDFPKIEPEAYNLSQNVQVGKNVRQSTLKGLENTDNSYFL